MGQSPYPTRIQKEMASKTPLKSRLQNGEKLHGHFLLSFSPELAEIAARAGFDFIIVDMEHGAGYLGSYADKLFIMCQIESEEGVKNVNEIVAVDGMDCVMMGPRDLSASLGILNDPGNPKLKSVMKEAETAVLASDPTNGGAYLAGMTTAQDKALDLKARGVRVN